jgi:hypothetical protein
VYLYAENPRDSFVGDRDGAAVRFLPETKGHSLEDMDVIFGAVSADQRQADILKHEKVLSPLITSSFPTSNRIFSLALEQERENSEDAEHTRSFDYKV